MTKPTIKIVNVQTGEELEREMTSQEIAQLETDATNAAARIATEESKETARQAVLAKLGLTAEEAAALLA